MTLREFVMVRLEIDMLLRSHCLIVSLVLSAALGLSAGRAAYAQTYPTAKVNISGSAATVNGVPETGTLTVVVNGSNAYTETVDYGPFSTGASLASALAAEFCHDYVRFGLYAKAGANNNTDPTVITFQLTSGPFGPITVTSSQTAGPNPFAASESTPAPTSLVTSGNPIVVGSAVTLTASVPAGATGSITFLDGTTSLGSASVSNASAFLSTSSLAVGTHSITAVYGGDDMFDSSISNTLSQVVNTIRPTLAVTTSSNPVNEGSAVTFIASISAGPTGSVEFHDGSTFLGAATLSGSAATFTTSSLAAGAHTITASWGGNANYSPVTSSVMNQTVNGIQLPGQQGITTTIAGTGVAGFAGDGQLATTAEVLGPSSIATDAAHNVFFCDGYYRVRKITAATGIITTVAGIGTGGYTGIGGPATNAQIECSGLAVDSAGDIYILNLWQAHPYVTEVSASTGIISTIAGNGTAGYSGDGASATNAAINPGSIGVDSTGNLYLSNNNTGVNSGTYALRVVSKSTGIISSPLPHQSFNSYIAVDGSGNIYTFSQRGGYIFKTSSASGSTGTIVAGTGQVGYTGDGSPALNATIEPANGIADASGNVYFQDGAAPDGNIRKVNATTGVISTVAWAAGPGEGCLQQSNSIGDGCPAIDSPSNLAAVDDSGNLYSVGVNRIRVTSPLSAAQIQPSTISITCTVNSGGVTFYGTEPVCSSTVTTGATGSVSLAYPSGTPNLMAYSSPAPIASGTASQTLPTANVPVGTYTIIATYSGDATHVPSIGTTSVNIVKNTPVITWPHPASIMYGTPLNAQQLNASATAPGIFTYTPGLTAVLPVGSNTLSVSFSPTDNTDYTSPVTMSQTISVTTATPIVFWTAPSPIEYGTQLSPTQLDATADVQGSFVYSPAAGTVLPVGVSTLSVTFTPTTSSDNSSNAPVTSTVQIQVSGDSPAITGVLPNPVAAGATVTINGQNFGPSKGSSTVTFNGVVATTVTTWEDNAIVATIPAGTKTGNVVVNVGGNMSNSFLIMISTPCP